MLTWETGKLFSPSNEEIRKTVVLGFRHRATVFRILSLPQNNCFWLFSEQNAIYIISLMMNNVWMRRDSQTSLLQNHDCIMCHLARELAKTYPQRSAPGPHKWPGARASPRWFRWRTCCTIRRHCLPCLAYHRSGDHLDGFRAPDSKVPNMHCPSVRQPDRRE